MAKKKPEVKTPGDDAAPAPSAPAAPVAPAVARATEAADKMSYAEAVRLNSEGKLTDRVLTERGWYIPNAAAEVA